MSLFETLISLLLLSIILSQQDASHLQMLQAVKGDYYAALAENNLQFILKKICNLNKEQRLSAFKQWKKIVIDNLPEAEVFYSSKKIGLAWGGEKIQQCQLQRGVRGCLWRNLADV